MVNHQDILNLKQKGLSYNQISNELNIPKGSVKYYLDKAKIENVAKEPATHSVSIIEKISQDYWMRRKIDTRMWRNALNSKDVYGNNYQLSGIYQEIMLDTHVQSVINLRKSKLLGMKYKVYQDGTLSESLHKLFDSQWFNQFIDIALDSILEGFSIPELTIDENGKMEFTKIPMRFINIEKQLFKLNAQLNDDSDAISYNADPYKNYLLEIYRTNRKDLGVLASIAPLYIWKLSAMQSWALHTETFAQPVRIAKTPSNNKAERDRLFNLVKAMGNSLSMVLGANEEIDIKQQSTGDVSAIYLDLINLCDQEISKILLSGTLITDSAGSKAQGTIHAAGLDSLIKSDANFLKYIINDRLIPMLQNLGIIPKNVYFEYDLREQLSLSEKFAIDKSLMERGEILDKDYLMETYDTKLITELGDVNEQRKLEIMKSNGGQNILNLQQAVQSGSVERTAAVNTLIYAYYFEPEIAEILIPTTINPVVKFNPFSNVNTEQEEAN